MSFFGRVGERVRDELGEGSGVFVGVLGDEREIGKDTGLMWETSEMSWSFSFSLVFL